MLLFPGIPKFTIPHKYILKLLKDLFSFFGCYFASFKKKEKKRK